jgi:hypothetical protein
MVPGACILIFAALGQWFFTRKFGLAFVLFFGVPYGILIFSWYRLVDRIEK